MTFNEKIEFSGGQMGLYANGPSGRDVPALIVLQEIFGVNAGIRETVDAYARHGFRAVAPDLFWRQGAGIALDPNQEASHALAVQHTAAYRQQPDRANQDLQALVAQLRQHHDKIGVIGYCLGGRIAFQMWLHFPVDAVVSYYGVGLDELAGQVADQQAPLLLHFGAKDHLICAEGREKVLSKLQGKPQCEAFVYQDVGHAFARRGGKTRHPASAELADQRSLDFLLRHLKGAA